MQTDGRTSCLFCYTYSLAYLPSYSLMHIFSIKFTFFFSSGHLGICSITWETLLSRRYIPNLIVRVNQVSLLCLSLRHVDKAFGDQVHRSFIRFELWEFGLFSLSCSSSYALAASSCCWRLLPVGSAISMGYRPFRNNIHITIWAQGLSGQHCIEVITVSHLT